MRVRFFFDNEPSREWAEKLPMLWRAATIDRSRLTVTTGQADVTIMVFTTTGQSNASGYVMIHPPYRAIAFIHEIGHALGCCYGPGTKAGHFISGPPGVMSDPLCADCLLFSDRELEQMGLGSKE